MKLYPSFDHDRLVLVGAGIFPWLFRDHWILGEHLEGRLVRLGKRKVVRLPKKELKLSYSSGKLKVMGKTVVASETFIHQLASWLEAWKNHE